MINKIQIHYEDVVRILAILDSVPYNKDDAIEIEVDSSSGIGSVGTVHVPVKINSLPGMFSYTLWAEESW